MLGNTFCMMQYNKILSGNISVIKINKILKHGEKQVVDVFKIEGKKTIFIESMAIQRATLVTHHL